MQRHLGVGGLGHRRDLLAFGDAAGVRDIGLHDGQRAASQRIEEHPLAHPALAGGDRRARGLGDLVEHIDALDRHWLLDEKRPVRLKRLDQLHGDARVRVVDVDGDIDAGAGAAFDRGKYAGEVIDPRSGRPTPSPGPKCALSARKPHSCTSV